MRNWIHEIISSLDGLSVYIGDHVAALQAGLFRRAAGLNAHDHHAIGRAQFLERDRVGAQIFLETDANRSAGNASLLNQLVVDIDGDARGQSKADAFVAAAASDNRGVNANYFACQIY